MEQSDLKVGSKVRYRPKHFEFGEFENGIVKEIPTHTDDAVRVVFNCDDDWDNYQNYTSALTNLRDLWHGWR